MTNEQLLLLAIAIGCLLIGALIAYFIVKSNTVNKSKFQHLKEVNTGLQYQIENKLAIEQELRSTLQSVQSDLALERQTNRNQEKDLASVNTIARNLEERVQEEQIINQKQQESINNSNEKILALKAEIAKIETLKASLEDKINQQSDEFEEARKKSLVEFENIANRLFEEKTTKFSQQSKENIEQLLNPLKENLKEFKQKVEETYDKESKQRFSLEGRIKELVELNEQISKDATNLTNALKGQAKTQGDWGEMILESILEYSGLVKNRQYFAQESFVDAQGKQKQPDFMIKYPDDRFVIIDSKVSLVAYEKYANAESREEQKLYLQQHIQSVKNHIINLSKKEYEQFNNALDFVFLFIPIEPAFLTALKEDDQLWNFAYSRRIILMSPTNLIATLRIIADLWKKELQNSNAREISDRGEKLYNKFVGFVANMEDIGKHMKRANNSYNDAMKQLSTGSGNLVGQAKKLKGLGLNPKKQLPKHLLKQADEEE